MVTSGGLRRDASARSVPAVRKASAVVGRNPGADGFDQWVGENFERHALFRLRLESVPARCYSFAARGIWTNEAQEAWCHQRAELPEWRNW